MPMDAVIFDLDGLLADTERLHHRAYQEALGRHGVTLTEEEYSEHWIRCGLGIVPFIEKHGLDIKAEVIRQAKAEAYRRLVERTCRPMPGAIEALKRLRGKKALALASSAYPDAVAAVAGALGIRFFFDAVVTQGDVKRVKPWPDLFLLAAERLKKEAGRCVVVEDAEKGVRAAHAAGMFCVAVPNDHTRGNDFSLADRVLSSLDELTVECVDGLGKRGSCRLPPFAPC